MAAQWDVFREVEGVLPVDDLAVRIVRIFGTERRPADETLEHNCASRPPVAGEGVALAAENLRGDVVRRSDSRVSHDATGFTPGIDLGAVANGEVDLVEGDRVAVAGPIGGAFEELLVVRILVLCMESSRQTEIGELDVATAVE